MYKGISESKRSCAERIRQIRRMQGYSQEYMASIFDISLSAYKKIENGENNISLKGLKILKDTFGVSADYILYGEERDSEDVWKVFNNCSELEKVKLFLKIVMYFGDDSKKCFRSGTLNDEMIDRIIEQIKNFN